jgi:pimeloyl-ACP methyl ester carboxylesterase
VGLPIRDEVLTLPDGRRVGYRVRGADDAHPVLYFHGQPASRLEADLWDDAAVTAAEIRLVSFDRPGMGASDLIPARDMTLDVDDALRIADHLGIGPASVMGVSAGGAPAMAFSAVHPERVLATVLVSATGPYDDETFMTEEDIDEYRRLRSVGAAAMVDEYEAAARRMRADPAAGFAEWLADFPDEERRWAATAPGRDRLVTEIREALRQGGRGWLRETEVRSLPWTFELSGIRTPVRAFHGRDDAWERLENIERVLAAVPDPSLHVYEGGNHLSPLLDQVAVLSATRRSRAGQHDAPAGGRGVGSAG